MNKNERIQYRALELAQAANFLAAICRDYPAEEDYIKAHFETLTIQYEYLRNLLSGEEIIPN